MSSSSLFAQLTAPNGLKYTQPLGLFIDNEWVPSQEGDRISSVSPFDESVICDVHGAGADDIDAAVRAARKAFRGEWRELDTAERGSRLFKLAALMEENAHILATIESWDNGKPYNVALTEDIPEAIAVIKYYAGWADKNHGQVIDPNPKKIAFTLREPIGVCGAITPWNFPLDMAAYKIGPALATGNTLVLKPAEQTPLSVLYLATLIKEAGIPPGVVNIVNGLGRKAGAAIAQHPGINKISFTGSTPTGKEITKMASATMKRVTLETGGKSPMIVFPDADLGQAAKWGHVGIMSHQGQVCSATSRIFVHESIYDDFLALYKKEVLSAKIGNPFDDDTFQGPQVTRAQFERVLSYIDSGKRDGATLALGGEAHKDINGKGFFVKPTVFTDVTSNMKIYQEEVFGPFVVICKFKTEEEAIEHANDSSFGLGGAVFTRDISRALRVSRRIEAGTVWVNSSNDADVRVPFGGHKQSGIGSELGEEGLRAYTITKSIHVNIGARL